MKADIEVMVRIRGDDGEWVYRWIPARLITSGEPDIANADDYEAPCIHRIEHKCGTGRRA